MRPFVSVVIPTYNNAHFIAGAVATVHAQKNVKLEILLVDDASTDNTQEVLSKLKCELPKDAFKIITHDTNKGVSAARNSGIKEATGDYIALLDADDRWQPEKLARQYSDLKHSPNNQCDTFCMTYFNNLHANGNFSTPHAFIDAYGLSKKENSTDISRRIYQESEIGRGIAQWDLWFCPGSTLFAHRAAIEKNGLFEEKLGCAEDIEFIMRHILLNDGKVRVVPEFLVSYFKPDEPKKYSTQDTFHEYFAKKYKCAVAQRYGGEAAERFLDTLSQIYRSINRIPNPFQKAARESLLRIAVIGPTAPCHGDFVCPLKTRICNPGR